MKNMVSLALLPRRESLVDTSCGSWEGRVDPPCMPLLHKSCGEIKMNQRDTRPLKWC